MAHRVTVGKFSGPVSPHPLSQHRRLTPPHLSSRVSAPGGHSQATRVGMGDSGLFVAWHWVWLARISVLWACSMWSVVGVLVAMMEDLHYVALPWKEVCSSSPCKYLTILMYLFWACSSCVSLKLTLFNQSWLLFAFIDIMYLSYRHRQHCFSSQPLPHPAPFVFK